MASPIQSYKDGVWVTVPGYDGPFDIAQLKELYLARNNIIKYTNNDGSVIVYILY